MSTLAVTVTYKCGSVARFDVPDVGTALVVAEINLDEGTAEITGETGLLARLRRRVQGTAGFWQINP
ncbi:hypothetical protein LY632_13155 [Erythrobacter sp. SDW2]|uniref:hypothetical protein n=1 Tax=Erythrobacter sp. SDW2 TaxID=2907154 RepID=UPI001F46A12F|nr:hypothetical protein [Erythrobacter sp. SDW2]UIP06616.1 hypothetical protein LY632_13155 [Erythrobacter sp. SDW2]